jgi:hypothetical protein
VDLKTLKPGIGLGDIAFGMPLTAITTLLGAPGGVEEIQVEPHTIEWWFYSHHAFIVVVDHKWNKVVKIITWNHRVMLHHQLIMGHEKKLALKEFEELGLIGGDETWGNADDPAESIVRFEQQNIEVKFEKNRLTLIQLEPLAFDGRFLWPAI